jgi:hypothetical protein
MKQTTLKQLINDKTYYVELIQDCWQNIYRYNTTLADKRKHNTKPVNILNEYNKIREYEEVLIGIKLKIAAYNIGLTAVDQNMMNTLQTTNNAAIYRRSAYVERKGYLSHLKIKEGRVWDKFEKRTYNWVSTITHKDIAKMVKEIDEKLTTIDIAIKRFNEQTIEI